MEFSESLTACQQRIDRVLTQQLTRLPFYGSPLVNAMEYGLLPAGKRLRPLLVYMTGEMLQADSDCLDAAAAAIECIHAYSLIHDDLPAMDNDSLRRGQPTCHIKFGEDSAILAGDALQTLAFSLLAEQPMPGVTPENRIRMIAELAQASGVAGMCGGQALDLAAEGKQTDLTALERIHRHKTGALIRAAVRLGALAAGERGVEPLPALDRFASAIGLAFQIQDDILDVIGESIVTGKLQGADQSLKKSTYPALIGLDESRLKIRDLYQESLSALGSLSALSVNTASLQALAHYIIERDK